MRIQFKAFIPNRRLLVLPLRCGTELCAFDHDTAIRIAGAGNVHGWKVAALQDAAVQSAIDTNVLLAANQQRLDHFGLTERIVIELTTSTNQAREIRVVVPQAWMVCARCHIVHSTHTDMMGPIRQAIQRSRSSSESELNWNTRTSGRF
jgi:hypothetical protein